MLYQMFFGFMLRYEPWTRVACVSIFHDPLYTYV